MSNEEKLVRMLKYVSEHNDFYKKRIKEYGITNPLDITQWPVLTRKELQENRYNMFSDGYKSKYFNQQLRRQSSSGSTGIPVNVYWDYKDWYASNMCLWRKRLEWYGIKPNSKYCIFTLNAFGITPEEGKLYYINEPSNVLSFNVSLVREESGYEQMAKLINNFEPDWLYIQPFVLNQLIRAYGLRNLAPTESIYYIESVGEILTSELRKRAEEIFHVKVTNMYGSEEMNGIAYECPDRHMHVLQDNVYLETGNCNEAIITNLCNHSMPLIRYNQEDKISVEKSKCSYGNQIDVLSSVLGRKLDIITVGNGVINPNCILEIMADVINQYNDIVHSYSFEISQSKRSIVCQIELPVLQSFWLESVENTIREAFSKKTIINNQLTIDVRFIQRYEIDKKKRDIFRIVE